MKSIILMTIAIFLVSAPPPDAKTIAEISGGFLSVSSETGLSASEVARKVQINSDTATLLAIQSENEEIKFVNL